VRAYPRRERRRRPSYRSILSSAVGLWGDRGHGTVFKTFDPQRPRPPRPLVRQRTRVDVSQTTKEREPGHGGCLCRWIRRGEIAERIRLLTCPYVSIRENRITGGYFRGQRSGAHTAGRRESSTHTIAMRGRTGRRCTELLMTKALRQAGMVGASESQSAIRRVLSGELKLRGNGRRTQGARGATRINICRTPRSLRSSGGDRPRATIGVKGRSAADELRREKLPHLRGKCEVDAAPARSGSPRPLCLPAPADQAALRSSRASQRCIFASSAAHSSLARLWPNAS
jgi:hypothetical protein